MYGRTSLARLRATPAPSQRAGAPPAVRCGSGILGLPISCAASLASGATSGPSCHFCQRAPTFGLAWRHGACPAWHDPHCSYTMPASAAHCASLASAAYVVGPFCHMSSWPRTRPPRCHATGTCAAWRRPRCKGTSWPLRRKCRARAVTGRPRERAAKAHEPAVPTAVQTMQKRRTLALTCRCKARNESAVEGDRVNSGTAFVLHRYRFSEGWLRLIRRWA